MGGLEMLELAAGVAVKTLCSKIPSFRARSCFCGWFVVMTISKPNRLAIVVWAPTSEKACHGLESGPEELDFLYWSSQPVASIFSLCCYKKKTHQTHEWVQKDKLQVLVVLKSTRNFRFRLYWKAQETSQEANHTPDSLKKNKIQLTYPNVYLLIYRFPPEQIPTSRTRKGRKWESNFFQPNVSTTLSKSIVFLSTSAALYAGAVYFLMLSSSMEIPLFLYMISSASAFPFAFDMAETDPVIKIHRHK